MKNREKTLGAKIAFIIAMVLCLSSFISSPVALALGFLFAWLIGQPFALLSRKLVSNLLKIAVVGLGFGMNLQETLRVGKDGLLLTIGTICFIFVAGYFIGRWLRLQRKTTHLISSGTAICGGSAIAAISPVINASERDISVSLGVIFLLNSIALLVFPSIGHLFQLSQHQFGLWSAIAIHDTSSVVGAAFAYGDEALKVATTVKLSRALWIIPMSLFSVYLFKGKSQKVKIPWFIFLFVCATVLNSCISLPVVFTLSVTTVSKSLLVLTLFLIGANLSVDTLKAAGWKPMVLGTSLWLAVSAVSLGVILWVS